MLTWSELTDVSLIGSKEYERNLQKYRIKSLYDNINVTVSTTMMQHSHLSSQISLTYANQGRE